MSTAYLELNTFDPIVARDGRPFGVGQGNRMRGLPWPFPSVVAGSFRTALVKATGGDFSGSVPTEIMKLAVAGVFPVAGGELYLPAPNDCVVEEITTKVGDKSVKTYQPHRAQPEPEKSDVGEGCDWPDGVSLRPVVIEREGDFKPYDKAPVWWPMTKYIEWLRDPSPTDKVPFFDKTFLLAAKSEERTQIEMNAEAGSVEEGKLFTTAGVRLSHLPRFGAESDEKRFEEKFAEIAIAARVETDTWDADKLSILHPLGGERRLAHWSPTGMANLWDCSKAVTDSLGKTEAVRMVLTTPAIFKHGWRPDWIDKSTLMGRPEWWGDGPELKLVGVSIPRWKAVSGWSLAPLKETGKPGPKAIKRLVPAGGVYFFTVESGNAGSLAEQWLRPVSDDEQDRLDGFGLAVWGTWNDTTQGSK